MNRPRLEKDNETLRQILERLVDAAERVSDKFGYDDGSSNEPSDWDEWAELRRAIQEARTKGKL